jgi:hypothetical protein
MHEHGPYIYIFFLSPGKCHDADLKWTCLHNNCDSNEIAQEVIEKHDSPLSQHNQSTVRSLLVFSS